MTQGLGEYEEQESSDEEEEKVKLYFFFTSLRKKAQGTKRKLVVKLLFLQTSNNPRTKATANAEKIARKRVVETNIPSASKPKRRKLVKGPPIGKTKSIDEVCANLRRSSGLSSFRFIKYDTLDNTDRTKVEEAMIYMIYDQNLAPNEVEKKIPTNL